MTQDYSLTSEQFLQVRVVSATVSNVFMTRLRIIISGTQIWKVPVHVLLLPVGQPELSCGVRLGFVWV